jgi:N-acetylneuraminate synthase/sialic acid synthase
MEQLPRSLEIGGMTVDDYSDCYVIAEIGHNHQGSVETAKAMFRAAADAGASAVKLQKRDNRSLYTRAFFDKPYNGDNSFGRTYGEHREALEFDEHEYAELIAYAAELGVAMFATAFDLPSIEFLEQFDLPAYKVASADVNNHLLMRELGQTGRPIIFSTGGASIEEVRRAHEVLSAETDQLCVLQCTAGYPAAWDELDLRVVDTYRRIFPSTVVGLSSHDNGIAMAVAAYVLGARMVEKHFTLDRTMRGSDHAFSLEPQGLRKMVRDLGRTRLALGAGIKRVYGSERAPIEKMSKKLVASRKLEAGCVLAVEDIALRSPGNGLAPAYLDRIVGRRLKAALEPDGDLTLDIVEEVTPPPSPASPARSDRKRQRARARI